MHSQKAIYMESRFSELSERDNMQACTTADVNGTQLSYEVIGNGYPLVLIHGGAVGRKIWHNQLTALRRR